MKQKVFIPLPDGILSEQLDSQQSDDNTRLLYVALTRARKQVVISYHQFDHTSESERSPSMFFDFFAQLNAGVKKSLPAVVKQQQLSQRLYQLLSPPVKYTFRQEAKDFFAQKVKTLIMSPTMLNDYLADT